MDSNDLKHLQELQKEHPDKVKKWCWKEMWSRHRLQTAEAVPDFYSSDRYYGRNGRAFYHGPWENPLRELPVTPIQKLRFTGNGRDNAETAPVHNHFI